MFEILFTEVEAIFVFNTLLCLFAGFTIGLERESRGKDAGISTHSLVIMGSMLFTYLSALVEPNLDARIAAQVVTGIGFLGAGLILKDGITVRNLTTAANLWFAAAIGMSFGFGYYVVGIFSTLVAIAVPRFPHLVDKRRPDVHS